MFVGPRRGSDKLASVLSLALGLSGVACSDPPEPCGAGQNLDVHFAYATGDADADQPVTRACALVFAGETSTGAGLIVLECPAQGQPEPDPEIWEVDLEGADPLALELPDDQSDPQVTARSQVADPDTLACGERGWLAIDDAEGRWLLAVAALPAPALVGETTLDLGELGRVSVREGERDGCPGLVLSRELGPERVWVPAAASTAIELAGVALIVELGPRAGTSCASAGYDLLLRRAPV